MEFNAYQIMEKVSLLNKPLFHLNLSFSDLNISPPYKYAVRVMTQFSQFIVEENNTCM